MIAFKVPPCCKECSSLIEYPGPLGSKFYCHMKAIDPTAQQQDISTIFVDPETRPEWCPMVDCLKGYSTLEPKAKEGADMFLRGLAILFNCEDLLEEIEEEDTLSE